jgi:hypothetical protein
MNTAVWTAQILLAMLYLLAGLWKLMGKGPQLEKMMPGFSLPLIRLLGAGEGFAALCLAFPLLLRDWMTVAAFSAIAIALEAALFVPYHLRYKAYGPAVWTLILGLLAAFVAGARLG